MHSYGFTETEISLPTPAVYISYLSQLSLNIKYHMKKKVADISKSHDESSYREFMVNMANSFIETNHEEQWGFTIKSGGSHVDYEKSKRILIPFTFALVDDIDNEIELSYVF